jgi:hypothetical protein
VGMKVVVASAVFAFDPLRHVRRRRLDATAALAAALLALGCAAGDGNGNPGDGASSDGLPGAPTCAWSARPPELILPSAEVKGVLRGTSRNASTTCTRQKGAGGPEAIYLLRVSERSLIELEVTSTIDTVLAVRRACDDPLTELACNDTPAGNDPTTDPFPTVPVRRDGGPPDARRPDGGPPVDAGVPVDAAPALPQLILPGTRDGHLRTVLEPGTYFVLVDEAERFGVGGEYVIKATAGPPPGQASCSTAQTIQDGTRLLGEDLDLASEKAISCTGGDERPALYYRATVPSGQRLTARATPVQGDRPWLPVLQLMSTCRQGMCLATDRAGPLDPQRMLRYVNNGPGEQSVLLSVGASTAVGGGMFRLDVSIDEPLHNVTCAGARPVTDGRVLLNQDLSEAQGATESVCKPTGAPSLFYSATLLEKQNLHVEVSQDNPPPHAPLLLILHEGCNVMDCRGGGQVLDYTNIGPGTRTVIIEVVGPAGLPTSPFDLRVSMPPPPAGIVVTPTRGLQTSEQGAQATFQVALASPPLQPVIIPVVSVTPAEGTASPTQLTFDDGNWKQPQTVTVTGADDTAVDGARAYQVRVGPAQSGDARYPALPSTLVSLVNRDDEPGFHFQQARAPLLTSETASKDTFTVVLTRAPTATVRLPLSSSDAGEGQVSPAELVFEPQSWNQAQTVTLTGVDDADGDGAQVYRVVTGAALSSDPQYAGLDPQDLEARNGDNDFERLAPRVVNGNDLTCRPIVGPGPRIAADADGIIYAVMACTRVGGFSPADPGAAAGSGGAAAPPPLAPPIVNANIFVATSLDGGRTFGAPVDTGQVSSLEYLVAATDSAVVVLSSGPSGTDITRSDDRGATWQPPVILTAEGGNLKLAAAGQRVVAAADTTGGPTLFVSDDAGVTFQARAVGSDQPMIGLGLAPDSGDIWTVIFEGNSSLLRFSADGGATFEPAITLARDAFFTSVIVGPRSIFAAGQDSRLLVLARDGSTRRHVDGLFPALVFPHLVLADPADNALVLETVESEVRVRRLPAGASTFLPARLTGLTQMLPSAVPLADNALAVMLWNSGEILVAVETWP